MKPKKVIIDTGPLIAFLNKSDYYYDWALTQFSQLNSPFFTCEAVISEACFLLRNTGNGMQNVLKLLDRELIQMYRILSFIYSQDREQKTHSSI